MVDEYRVAFQRFLDRIRDVKQPISAYREALEEFIDNLRSELDAAIEQGAEE
jgi:uncharacterized protein YukE